jgi:hypothetical protein
MLRPSVVAAKPAGGPGPYTQGPLDIVAGAVFAYGQRALAIAKLGSAVYTIERDSDSTTQSFNSDLVTGAAPVAAISSFIGAGNGFLAEWNDQGPNGYNALQTDPTQQSQWIASLANGFPGFTGVVATGAGSSVPSQTISLANGAATVFLVSGPDTEVFLTAGGSGYIDLYMGRSVSHGPYIDLFDGTNEAGGMYSPFSGVHVIDAAWQFGSADFRVDGVSQTQQSSFDSGGALSNPVVNGTLTLFIDYNAAASINDVCLEILVYNSILSGANRTAIRQNIAAYYGITL